LQTSSGINVLDTTTIYGEARFAGTGVKSRCRGRRCCHDTFKHDWLGRDYLAFRRGLGFELETPAWGLSEVLPAMLSEVGITCGARITSDDWGRSWR